MSNIQYKFPPQQQLWTVSEIDLISTNILFFVFTSMASKAYQFFFHKTSS